MDIVAFASKIDAAIRRKITQNIDKTTNTFTNLTAQQREDIIDLYTDFVITYKGLILDYLQEISGDNEFVEWCTNNWKNMYVVMAALHTQANILTAAINAAISNYMRMFRTKCVRVGANDLYDRRMKELARMKNMRKELCSVQ